MADNSYIDVARLRTFLGKLKTDLKVPWGNVSGKPFGSVSENAGLHVGGDNQLAMDSASKDQLGTVSLSDAVDSSANAKTGSTAATPAAVKKAYDKAVEAASKASYTLPQATNTVLGGVKLTQSIDESGVSEGYAATPVMVKEVSDLVNLKQDKITAGTGLSKRGNTLSLVAAGNNILGGVKLYNTADIDAEATIVPLMAHSRIDAGDAPSILLKAAGLSYSKNTGVATFNEATQKNGGMMSAADKKKLDGIATGANNYSLPVASSSNRGGMKVFAGSNLSSFVYVTLGNSNEMPVVNIDANDFSVSSTKSTLGVNSSIARKEDVNTAIKNAVVSASSTTVTISIEL